MAEKSPQIIDKYKDLENKLGSSGKWLNGDKAFYNHLL